MHRFFIKRENIIDESTIWITGDDVRHIANSLRLKPGEEITVSTGEGMDYLVEIRDLTKENIVCRVLEVGPCKSEPALKVTLFQGLPKSDKLDLIVQKCTELGIERITPVETKRTIVKLDDKKADRRLDRWQKIAEEAGKQSGRGKIPTIGPVVNFKEMLEMFKREKFDLILVPWEDEAGLSLREALTISRSHKANLERIAYIIGPEGGLAEEEVQTLKDAGAKAVTLGPRILRTETAGFVVLTVLMYEFMEMEGSDRR